MDRWNLEKKITEKQSKCVGALSILDTCKNKVKI